ISTKQKGVVMKSSRLVASLCGLALASVSAVAGAGKDIVRPADSIKWEDGPVKGTHVAKLWGDWMKGGPYGVLIKFDAGLMPPLHWHSHDLRVVVLSGTFVHQEEGGKEDRLGPGSFLREVGKVKHISGCAAGADCEFAMTSSDKFDMTMVEQGAGKKD